MPSTRSNSDKMNKKRRLEIQITKIASTAPGAVIQRGGTQDTISREQFHGAIIPVPCNMVGAKGVLTPSHRVPHERDESRHDGESPTGTAARGFDRHKPRHRSKLSLRGRPSVYQKRGSDDYEARLRISDMPATYLFDNSRLTVASLSPQMVGLRNLGDTCYINVVVQALFYCPGAATAVRTACSAAWLSDNPAKNHESMEETRATTFKDVGPATREVCTHGDPGCGSMHVLLTLASLFDSMQAQTTELTNVTTSLPHKAWPLTKERHSSTGVPGLREVDVKKNVKDNSNNLFAHRKSVQDQWADTNHRSPPGQVAWPVPLRIFGKGHRQALDPSELVHLIRRGQSTARVGRGIGGGQQCASELLSTLCNVGSAPPGSETCLENGSGRAVLSSVFGGRLCVHTTCLECERDRRHMEDFSELTLPSFRSHASTRHNISLDSDDKFSPEARPLRRLLEETLGDEYLEGSNKVWCDTCQQRCEAVRTLSLHSAPEVLALHIRPSLIGLVAKAAGRETDIALDSKGGYLKGVQNLPRERVIDLVLELRLPLVCGDSCSNKEIPRTAATSTETGLCSGSLSGTIDDNRSCLQYNLVGIISHVGRGFESGHYTFALNRSLRETTSCPGVDSELSETDAVSSRTRCVERVSQGCEGDGVFSDEEFVLFDDEHVRWLFPHEKELLLSGGGSGDVGEPFVVFYALDRSTRHPGA